MKGPDKFLIGIVAGMFLLVVVAFAVVLLRPEPEYRSDDSPEAAVHNYLLALRQEDYERAYGFLSPRLKSYPGDVEAFVEEIEARSFYFRLDRDVSLSVQSATVRSSTATVDVLETQAYNNGPFNSRQVDRTFDMKLRQENGAWKLIDGDSFWNPCWDEAKSGSGYCW